MLFFGSIWKSTLYRTYRRRNRREATIIFNVIERRVFSFQFSFYCLARMMAGMRRKGDEGCAKHTTRSFGKRFADPIIDSPGFHSAVNQRHSCSFAKPSKTKPFHEWAPQPSTTSPAIVFVFDAFPFFPYYVFTFISSIFDFTLDSASHRA